MTPLRNNNRATQTDGEHDLHVCISCYYIIRGDIKGQKQESKTPKRKLAKFVRVVVDGALQSHTYVEHH